jgi:hypothetical protein
VQNFRFHAEGTAVLSADRTANLDVSSSVSGRTNLKAVLGRKTEAPGVHVTTASAVTTYADLNFIISTPLNISSPTVFWILIACDHDFANRRAA